MKASLITVHVGANFGSILQTIASVKILEKLNCSTTVINYIPYRVTLKGYLFCNFSLMGLIRRLIMLPNFVANNIIYSGFLKKFVTLSKPIYKTDTINNEVANSDFYITGSDQVWNSIHNQGLDTHYFWEGISPKAKKIAYASSFGRTKLDAEEFSIMKKYLNNYQGISVREASAVKILEEMELKGIQVIDPTFMLNKNEWTDYMTERKVKDNYLLIYTPYNTTDKNVIFRTARKIAKDKNLKIVTFSWDFRPDRDADITIRYASPGDFLSLFHYADCVLTNSFHGTAFSINFNKQFWVYMPSGFSTRLLSIIDLCHLNNRILEDEIDSSSISKTIDYSLINPILEAEREKAIDFLKRQLI